MRPHTARGTGTGSGTDAIDSGEHQKCHKGHEYFMSFPHWNRLNVVPSFSFRFVFHFKVLSKERREITTAAVAYTWRGRRVGRIGSMVLGTPPANQIFQRRKRSDSRSKLQAFVPSACYLQCHLLAAYCSCCYILACLLHATCNTCQSQRQHTHTYAPNINWVTIKVCTRQGKAQGTRQQQLRAQRMHKTG